MIILYSLLLETNFVNRSGYYPLLRKQLALEGNIVKDTFFHRSGFRMA